MRTWQRDLIRDLNRTANEPCTCENNGDLCPRCDAREYLKSGRVPRTRLIGAQMPLNTAIMALDIFQNLVLDTIPCWMRG